MSKTPTFVRTAALALLGFGLLVAPATAQVSGADQDIPGGHFYTQANGGASAQYGYRITDEGGVPFWSEFKRLGGVTALGYPASRRFSLNGFTVQATQKYILQWRPEVGQAYFENVFDDLHNQGKDGALQAQFAVPPPDASNADQNTRLGWLNADPALANRYGTGPGAIQAHGLPTSQVTTAGSAFKIVRNQRDAIQDWISAGPGGITPGTVSIVNGGDVAKALGLVPSDAAITETSSGQPQSAPAATATPSAAAPAATATPTGGFEFKSKAVTDSPVDCNNDSTKSSIPCSSVLPNSSQQFIKGRVMDQKGNHLQFVFVRAIITGGVSTTQQLQTAGDGTFQFCIEGCGTNSVLNSNCQNTSVQYQIMVLSNSGAVDSDTKTINYDGNCNSDGEFHFDFVKVT